MRTVTPAMRAVADRWNVGAARRNERMRRLARAKAEARVEAALALPEQPDDTEADELIDRLRMRIGRDEPD